MTIEESKAMWNIEKSNVDQVNFTKGMKALYKAVDKVIENGIITMKTSLTILLMNLLP